MTRSAIARRGTWRQTGDVAGVTDSLRNRKDCGNRRVKALQNWDPASQCCREVATSSAVPWWIALSDVDGCPNK